MLAKLKNLFAPQEIAQSLKTLPPIRSTIVTRYFNRPAHPSPMIGITDLKAVIQSSSCRAQGRRSPAAD